ncbi:sulfotransferase [Chloroflexota bacterium]
MSQKTRAPINEHPLALGSFRSWLRLLRSSQGIDGKYLPRALFVTLTTFLTSPLRLYERARYGKLLQQTAIHPSPVFIIGHWRSGTTYLHQLLCQDESFGYVSTLQGLTPGFCLMGEKWFKPMLAWIAGRAHPTRIIDNVILALDAPQEDEFALANLSPHSSLHYFSFPLRASTFFERYALHNNIPEVALTEWIEVFLSVLQKASLRCGGKQLVLKNPASSGRIRTLLGLFPEAKFIHIVRNPYDVYLSTLATWQTVLPRSQLQGIGPGPVEANVLEFYVRLMQAYVRDRALIPDGNLVEVRFEDLERAPVEEMGKMYQGLGLPGLAGAEPKFQAYADSMAGYEKNRFELSDEVAGRVKRHWGFAFEEWRYGV